MASPTTSIHQATYIDLPTSLTEHCNGLSLDFGGSVLKLAYRPKEKSPRQGEPPVAEGRERIRLAAYSRAELDKALSDIDELADIRRTNGGDFTPIITTGVGTHGYGEKIEKSTRVKSTNVSEMDCFIKCFKELSKHLTKSELVDPPKVEAEKEAQKIIDSMLSMVDNMSKHTDSKIGLKENSVTEEREVTYVGDGTLPLAEEDKDLFPCILVVLGSAFATLKIEKDGSFQMAEVSIRGGRSFLGLGSMLTGAKTFGELAALAERGDDSGVSLYTSDIIDHSRGDMYAALPDDLLVFSLGKTAGKDASDFKKEDIARGLVVHYATDIAFFIHMSLAMTDISNVYLCGNFANADIIRHELTKCLILRRLSSQQKLKVPFNFHFLKHGGFLGAIGAFIHKPKREEPEA